MNKKILKYLVIAIVAAIIGPLVINASYQVDNPIVTTKWDAVDVLDYYGTILSAIISVLVILITITNEHERIADERRNENKLIEAQRQFDNKMAILEKVSTSIMNTLQFMDPVKLYDLYYVQALSFTNDKEWLVSLRNDSRKYLTRMSWLVKDCVGRIDELSCYDIDAGELNEIQISLLELEVAYKSAIEKILSIGLELLRSSAKSTSKEFDEVYMDIVASNETNYNYVLSHYGQAIQRLRIQIMQKSKTELGPKESP